MQISVRHQFLPKTQSTRAAQVMDYFGIDFEQGEHVIADQLEFPLQANQIALFTGESGSGKSSLMRALRTSLENEGQTTITLDELECGEKILVDAIDLPFEQTLQLLSACGLGEAHLLLRTPQELSDGQRYRFQLAQALASGVNWIIADEFTATLDRTLAKVVSLNLRKLANRTKVGFLLATTHDDIVTDLDPDVHAHCRLNGAVDIRCRETTGGKKKVSHSSAISGSHPPPSATGRISLGGITAATNSG